jgi:hypothetical protein
MKQRQARSQGTPSQKQQKQELADKLERVREILDDENKRHFDEPLFDLTKLRQALDKAVPSPLDMKGYFAQIIRSPSRYEVIFDEAMKIADQEEYDVLNQLKEKNEDDIFDFANNFVRQRKPLPIFFRTFDIMGDVADISESSDEPAFVTADEIAQDEEIITGIRQKGEMGGKGLVKSREIKLIEQVNMDEGVGKGSLKNKPIFRSVKKSRPFIAEREELKAREGRTARMQPIPFGLGGQRNDFKEEKLKTCLQFYKIFPWVKDQVRDVFVAPISANFDDTFFIRSDFYEHVSSYGGFALTSDEVEKFYRPKEKYFQLQCYGTNKHYDDTDPNIIRVTWKEQEYLFMIGILTENRGFLIQNTDILTAEEDYIDNWLGKSEKRREELLESNYVPSDAKAVARNEILSALSSVVPKADLLYTNRILSNIVDKMVDLSSNTNDFFLRVADLIVFINPNISFVSSIFAKRLAKMQYKPEILPLLTPKEKLPEIFADIRIPEATIDQVNNTLHFQMERVFENLVNITVMYNVIPTRKQTRPFQMGGTGAGRIRAEGRDDKIIIGLPEWKNACVNADEVRNIPDEELIFYAHPQSSAREELNTDVFCFPINDLLDKFSREDVHNQYTGKDFSDAFVRRFLSVYSKPIQTERVVEVERGDDEPVVEGSLIKLIKAELMRIENNLIEPEYFQETELKCFGCKKVIAPGEDISSIYKSKKVSFCNMQCFEDKKW